MVWWRCLLEWFMMWLGRVNASKKMIDYKGPCSQSELCGAMQESVEKGKNASGSDSWMDGFSIRAA